MTSRRSFLIGAASLLAAPAIVRAGVLMPVRKVIEPAHGLMIYQSNPEGLGAYKMFIEFADEEEGKFTRGHELTPQPDGAWVLPTSHIGRYMRVSMDWSRMGKTA